MFTSIKPRFPSLINGHTCTLVCLYLDQTQNKVPVRETYWVQHSSDSVFTVWTIWYGPAAGLQPGPSRTWTPGLRLEKPRSFCSSFSLSVLRIILPVPSSHGIGMINYLDDIAVEWIDFASCYQLPRIHLHIQSCVDFGQIAWLLGYLNCKVRSR